MTLRLNKDKGYRNRYDCVSAVGWGELSSGNDSLEASDYGAKASAASAADSLDLAVRADLCDECD